MRGRPLTNRGHLWSHSGMWIPFCGFRLQVIHAQTSLWPYGIRYENYITVENSWNWSEMRSSLVRTKDMDDAEWNGGCRGVNPSCSTGATGQPAVQWKGRWWPLPALSFRGNWESFGRTAGLLSLLGDPSSAGGSGWEPQARDWELLSLCTTKGTGTCGTARGGAQQELRTPEFGTLLLWGYKSPWSPLSGVPAQRHLKLLFCYSMWLNYLKGQDIWDSALGKMWSSWLLTESVGLSRCAVPEQIVWVWLQIAPGWSDKEDSLAFLFCEKNKSVCLKVEASRLSLKGVMRQECVRIKSFQIYLIYSHVMYIWTSWFDFKRKKKGRVFFQVIRKVDLFVL